MVQGAGARREPWGIEDGIEARHRGTAPRLPAARPIRTRLAGRVEAGAPLGIPRFPAFLHESEAAALLGGCFFWLSRFFLQLFKARKREAELDFWEPGKRSWGGAKFTDFSKKMEGIPAKVDESASTKYCVDKALGVDILGSHLIRQGEGTFIGWRSSRRQF